MDAIYNVRTRDYPAPTQPLTGLPCRRFSFPNNPTLIGVVQDVLFYLTRPEAWTGSELDRLRVMSAISQAMLGIDMCEDDDMPIGAITLLATAAAPAGWLLCDGATYNRVDYPVLFELLDPAYQLDADTFKTPDMRGRVAVGGGHGDYALNTEGGEFTVTLDASQMPFHQHTFAPHTHGYQRPSVSDVFMTAGEDLASLVTTSTENANYSGYMTDGGQGGSLPHVNMQPYLVLNYAIRAV